MYAKTHIHKEAKKKHWKNIAMNGRSGRENWHNCDFAISFQLAVGHDKEQNSI
jgi:hypothetical protein